MNFSKITGLLITLVIITNSYAQRDPSVNDTSSMVHHSKCQALQFTLTKALEQYVDMNIAYKCNTDADCILVNSGKYLCHDEAMNKVAAEGYNLYYADTKVQEFVRMKALACPKIGIAVRCARPPSNAACENNLCVERP